MIRKSKPLLALLLVLCLSACTPTTSGSAIYSNSTAAQSTVPLQSVTQPQSAAPPQALQTESTSKPFDFRALENWEGAHPVALARGWYPDTGLGALFAERYLFQEDGTFYYAANEYFAERLRYMDGMWEYGGGAVTLTVHRKMVMEGGQVIENPGFGSRISFIEDGSLARYELLPEEYETIVLPIQVLDMDLNETPHIHGSISLNGKTLYAITSIGYEDLPHYWVEYEY